MSEEKITNYERFRWLPKEEMAWLLMNEVTSDEQHHGCPLCIYKDWSECKEIVEIRVSCIDGHRKWLDREPTEEDEILYAMAKHNVLVGIFNDMPQGEMINYRCVYGDNGYVERLEWIPPETKEEKE